MKKYFPPSSLFYFFVICTGVILIGLVPEALACPMCSELMEKGKDAFKAMRFGQGIAWSIALFFSVPLIMIGGMIFVISRSYKKVSEEQEHESKA